MTDINYDSDASIMARTELDADGSRWIIEMPFGGPLAMTASSNRMSGDQLKQWLQAVRETAKQRIQEQESRPRPRPTPAPVQPLPEPVVREEDRGDAVSYADSQLAFWQEQVDKYQHALKQRDRWQSVVRVLRESADA